MWWYVDDLTWFYWLPWGNRVCMLFLWSLTFQSSGVNMLASLCRGWNDLTCERPSFFILLLCSMLRFTGDLTKLIKKISKLETSFAKLWSGDAMKRNAVNWWTGLWSFSWLSVLASYPLLLPAEIEFFFFGYLGAAQQDVNTTLTYNHLIKLSWQTVSKQLSI